MRRLSIAAALLALGGGVVAASTQMVSARSALDTNALRQEAATANATVATYCVPCHSDRRKSAGISFWQFDVSNATKDIDLAERMIRRLRAGMMPPSGAARPAAAALSSLTEAIERSIDTAAAAAPADPGDRPFQRLNRAEYAQSIRDLVGIEIDPEALLPPDTISGGFDNVADVQTFSPTLVTSYLQAARQISGRAVANTSNRLVYVCRPKRLADEPACAARIVTTLATRAYRGAGAAEDVRDAMAFYERGRARGDFRSGIRLAIQSILVSPRFLFRLEPIDGAGAGQIQRAEASAVDIADGSSGSVAVSLRRAPRASDSDGDADPQRGQNSRLRPHSGPIDGIALASRLSFFLWSRAPDGRLLADAKRGLHDPAIYRAAVRRLLTDTRSSALASRFARQWLRLQDLESVAPDRQRYPHFDAALAASMLRETELFFESIVRADGSVLDLLTADYSFVDARLAAHYGLRPVRGDGFTRVTVPESRRGLLGQSSILMGTSLAGRTSPVLRGKWILEVLLGTPPPPPPPNVPALDDSAAAVRDGVRYSTRQRIEQHRRSPQCSSCHRVIDPLGLTLEHFDVTGAWRDAEDGVPIDARGDLFDGTTMNGPAGLRRALLDRKDLFLRTFTENLLTYALGRRLAAQDMPLVRSIVNKAAADDYRFSSFVMGVATSAPFTMTTLRGRDADR